MLTDIDETEVEEARTFLEPRQNLRGRSQQGLTHFALSEPAANGDTTVTGKQARYQNLRGQSQLGLTHFSLSEPAAKGEFTVTGKQAR